MTDPIATMKAGMRALAAALLLLGTAGYAGANTLVPPALTVFECETEFEESRADTYCDVITYGVAQGRCSLTGGCSVTAVTEIFTTDSNGMPSQEPSSSTMTHSLNFNASISLSSVDDLDVCFTHNSDGTQWTATFKTGCTTEETTAHTASFSGLSLN